MFFFFFFGGIFRFTSFIFGFAKFLGLLDLGFCLDAKKMLFCDDLWFWVFTDFFVCDFGSGPTGPAGSDRAGSGYAYRPVGWVRI